MHLFGPGPRGDDWALEGPRGGVGAPEGAEEAPEVIRENPGGDGLPRGPLEIEREGPRGDEPPRGIDIGVGLEPWEGGLPGDQVDALTGVVGGIDIPDLR